MSPTCLAFPVTFATRLPQLTPLPLLKVVQLSLFSSVQYINKEKTEGVLFAFRLHIPGPVQLPRIYLRGLDPYSIYRNSASNEISQRFHLFGVKTWLDNIDFSINSSRIVDIW